MAESASEAMGRATQVMVDAIHAEQDRAAERRVIDRIISEDEDAQPRDLPQIDDAALREAMGLF